MVDINEVVNQEKGFYFITYRSHPDSNEDFSYVDEFIYAQTSHQADGILKQQIRNISDPAASDYDLGIGICVPVNNLVEKVFDIETMEEIDNLDIREVESRLETFQPIVDEEMVREVGDRQEKTERSEMGEDVEDVVTIEEDELETYSDHMFRDN